jgi:hypothetical protein
MACALGRQKPPREVQLYKLLAFLGRYGHQSATEMLKLTVRELVALAAEVGELIREEGEAMRARYERD